MMQEETQTKIDILEDATTTIGLESRVVLYNDEWHTFDEVIVQLMKAIKCTFAKGRSLAFEVHTKGRAIVFDGNMPQCLRVSAILEEIALRTEIIT